VHEHIRIYDDLSRKYDKIKLSMTIGIDETPLKSNKNAHLIKNKKECLIIPSVYANKEETSTQAKKKIGLHTETLNNDIKVLHIDINNSTAITQNLSSYEITNLILKLYSTISDIFMKEESLSFYLGGDNFMVITKKKIKLNCGIGNGGTGRKAAELATKSLDVIREFRKKGTIVNVYESF
jgi:GTP cyclohydrolase IIa